VNPPRVSVLVERLGPYHVARLNALGRRLGADRVQAIEIAAGSTRTPWSAPASGGFGVVRLFPGRDYAELRGGRLRAAVRAALDALRPEAVAVNGWGFVEARAALRWCRATATPAVLMSDSQDRGGWRWAPREVVKRAFVSMADSAFVAGARHAAYVERLGMAPGRVILGYDVVDNAHFRDGAERARADAGAAARLGLPPRYFLCCARFIPEKNLPALLDAYARYVVASPPAPWDLVLVGDGPLGPRLRSAARALGVGERVRFTGPVQHPELPAYYGLASALVLPSASDTWGLVVNEAMAAGLPVLVSRACGCVPELVREGVNGFTFDPRDRAALAALLARVATAPDLEAMGRASRELVAAFTPETFAENMERAIDLAVGARPGSRRRSAA